MPADDALRVDQDQVRRLRACLDQQFRGPDVRRPGADQGDLDVGQLLADHL